MSRDRAQGEQGVYSISKMMETCIIISSPFQAICAIEAIETFSIQSPFFIILGKNGSEKPIFSLIDSYQYSILNEGQGTLNLVRLSKRIGSRFENLFIGDYFSFSQYVIASIVSKSNAVFTFLDDGNSTLELNPPVKRKRFVGIKKTCTSLPFLFLEKAKRITTRFFSIYEIDSSLGFNVIPNTFTYLKNASDIREQKGVYIIGTNPRALSLKEEIYGDKLESILVSIEKLYPGETIYFCKHRYDNTDQEEVFKKHNVLMYNTEVSVEVDFCKKSDNPRLIIGFGSTALLTLKFLFPQSNVTTILLELSDKEIEKSYQAIANYMQRFGVMINEIK